MPWSPSLPTSRSDRPQAQAALAATRRAEDPRALRARIAALERELQTSARERAPAPTERRIEVPVLTEGHVKRLEAVFHGAEKLSERTREALAAVVTAATAALQAIRARTTPAPGSPGVALLREQNPGGARLDRRRAADDTGLGAGEHKMLEALALRHPEPLSKAQLGLLAGYAASGGTFRTYLPRLHRAGLVDVRDDRVILTPAGRAAVGEFRHAPQTPEQVRTMWLSALDQGPRRMLEVLITAFPKALTKAELGEASGYEAAGGTFRTYLPKLRRLGLVEGDRDQVRASETLFV